MKKEQETSRPLTKEEIRLAESQDGWKGITGPDAPLALRGATYNSTTVEQILYAMAIVKNGEPGFQSVALNALGTALQVIRES